MDCGCCGRPLGDTAITATTRGHLHLGRRSGPPPLPPPPTPSPPIPSPGARPREGLRRDGEVTAAGVHRAGGWLAGVGASGTVVGAPPHLARRRPQREHPRTQSATAAWTVPRPRHHLSVCEWHRSSLLAYRGTSLVSLMGPSRYASPPSCISQRARQHHRRGGWLPSGGKLAAVARRVTTQRQQLPGGLNRVPPTPEREGA